MKKYKFLELKKIDLKINEILPIFSIILLWETISLFLGKIYLFEFISSKILSFK